MTDLEKAIRQNTSCSYEKPLTEDVILLQKKLVANGFDFLPTEFVAFLKKMNGVMGDASCILGIPPVQNKLLDIWRFNQSMHLPNHAVVLGFDDFAYLLYDAAQKQYRLLSRDLQTTLETFEKDEWEDALRSIIHFDNV